MAEILEAGMVICFGLSWPLSIIKSYKARSVKGKSVLFLFFILTGYALGIASKIIADKITYVFIFYIINFFMVFTDICMFYRNKRISKGK